MVDINALLDAELAAVEETTSTITIGGTEVTLRAYPLTPNDFAAIKTKHPNFMMNPTIEGMVDLIVNKARGDDGRKMFTLEHRGRLMRMASAKITKVFGDLFGDQITPDDDEAHDARLGKSKATA